MNHDTSVAADPASAAQTVDEFLRLIMIPDPVAARRYTAPGLRIRFTGGRAMRDPAEMRGLQREALQMGEEAHRAHRDRGLAAAAEGATMVYSLGTLYGEWPDGTPFEGNRYVDRYVVRDGLIVQMEVWNDSAEWLLVRAGLATPTWRRPPCRQYPGPLPDHGRFDYPPITRRAGYRWPSGAGLAVYLGFNLEHFAFGEGLGADIGPAVAAARRAELQLARIRQPRRRLALPGALRRAGAARRRR